MREPCRSAVNAIATKNFWILASFVPPWQSAGMPDPAPHKRPYAGGFLIVLGIMIGVVAGLIAGQPTIGFLVGGGTGAALAVALWLRDQSREG